MNFSFFLQFFTFIFLNILALTNAYIWSRTLRNFTQKPLLHITFETATLFTAQIITVQTILGMIGKLSFHTTALSILILSAITFFFYGKKALTDIKNLPIPPLTTIPLRSIIVFLSVPAVIIILRLFHSTLQIPLDYDSVTYHLPFAVEWFKNGNLWKIFYNPFLGPVGYYAGNFELLELWLIFPFGKDYLVNLINYPFLIGSALVLYQLCRNEGLGKTATFFTMAMTLSQPIIFILLGSQLVELFIIFTFLLTFYFLREYQKNQTFTSLIFIGLAAGLLIGTKFTGILYAGPFLLVIGWSFIKKFIKNKKPAHFFKKLLCIFLPILITAGFWYVRNWIDIGTPLYPVEIPFITHLTPMQNPKTDPLLIGTSLSANITTIDKFNEFLFYFIKRTGGQWLLIVVALVLGIKFSIQETLTFIKQRKKPRHPFPLALPLTMGSIIYFLLYWFLPYAGDPNVMIHNIRFALPFVFFCFFTASYLLEKIRTPWFVYGLAALGAFIYNIIFTYFKNPQNPLFNDFINIDGSLIKSHFGTFLLFLGLLIIAAYFLIITLSKKPFMNIGITLIAFLFSSSFYFWQSLSLRETLRAQTYVRWHQGDSNSLQWIEAAEWLNHNVENTNVALTGFTYSYPLYGRNYEHNVEYININNCIDCRTSDYRKNGLESRSEQNFQSWLENIKKKNIEYLVIDKKTFPTMHEYIWVQNKKEIFEEVYKNNLVSIFHLTQH